MTNFFRWLSLCSAVLFFSCEKVVDFTPSSLTPKLVVEATIENDQYPVVYLTHSFDVFSNLAPDQLAGAFIRNAVVTVSNGTLTHTLKEYEHPLPGGYILYYYSIDSSQLSSSFQGEPGTTYTLNIKAEGKEYSATTTIPELTSLINSLYYETNVDNEDSTKAILYGSFTDKPGYGNYTRYFTKVNDEPFFAGLNSVFDDQVIDGKSYDVQIEKGVDRNSDIDFENYSFFTIGDSVTVKFCNIDKGVFDFWRTMEYTYSSIGNPFSSPTKVKGNISNGALGYFGGYAVQYSGIIIKE